MSLTTNVINLFNTVITNLDKIVNALGDFTVTSIDSLGEIVSAVGSASSDIIKSLGNLSNDIINSIGEIINSIGSAISDVISALGEGISNIISSIANAVSSIINALGEAISNVITVIGELPGKIINLLESLLRRLFVPEDNYFSDKVDTLKSDLNGKIPYQSYQNELNKIDETAQNTGNSGEGITTSISLSNYTLSDKLSVKMNKFIDFSIFTKYRDVWFVWVRVVVYILLVLYWINETSKFFRGFSISSYSTSNVNQNTQTGGNNK